MFEKVVIKYGGELRELVLSDLDLLTPGNPSDDELKQAVSMALNIENLNEFAVDRGETVINIRPAATYA